MEERPLLARPQSRRRPRRRVKAALAAAKRQKPPPERPEAGNGGPVAPEGSQEPVRVRAVSRADPILPVVRIHSVNEHSAVEAGRLAFGGLVEGGTTWPTRNCPSFRALTGPVSACWSSPMFEGGRSWPVVEVRPSTCGSSWRRAS